MATDDVCPRCARPALLEVAVFSGRGHSCRACRGLLLDFTAVATLFDGLAGRSEPAPDERCRACRTTMSRVYFGAAAPLLQCDVHGVWLAPEDRALLPAALQRKLRWRERLARLFGGAPSGGRLDAVDVVEIVEALTSDASCGGGDAGGGGDASCGGGGTDQGLAREVFGTCPRGHVSTDRSSRR